MTDLASIQRHLGIPPDGIIGPVTLNAIGQALGIAPIVVTAPTKTGGASTSRRINAAGLKLIKEFEGCRLKAYRDIVGVWTIGYGSTGPHVTPGLTLTEAECEALLLKDLERFEKAIAAGARKATDNQYAAIVSLAFNVGESAVLNSTLLRLHNNGDYAGAADQFARWNRAGGRVVDGLTRRREAEAALYRKPGV
ncbi:MAG: lysozyme [Sphingobium sp.]